MRASFQVTISQGQPCVGVPLGEIWSLLEHLSYHRARIEYTYDDTNLSVCFVSTSLEAAQQLIDDWAVPGLSRK